MNSFLESLAASMSGPISFRALKQGIVRDAQTGEIYIAEPVADRPDRVKTRRFLGDRFASKPRYADRGDFNLRPLTPAQARISGVLSV